VGLSRIVYFQTPPLANGVHRIDVVVTAANETNRFIVDCFFVGDHSTPTPIMDVQSAPIGEIVGGVVGGIAGVVILALALWYFLFLRKRSRGDQSLYFEKPGTPAEILVGEGPGTITPYLVEPFDPTTSTLPPDASLSGPHAYPDNQLIPPSGPVVTNTIPLRPSQPDPNETVLTHVTGNSAQPRVGKAALIALRNQSVREGPAQTQDSGIRFNENGEREASPPPFRSEVPPTYSPG